MLETRTIMPLLTCVIALVLGFVIGRQLVAQGASLRRVIVSAEQAIGSNPSINSGLYQVPQDQN